MYAMGYNTTKKVCVGLGQTDEEGKKFAKFDDVVSKVEEALKTPDSQGTYADYVELLKLYDKNPRQPGNLRRTASAAPRSRRRFPGCRGSSGPPRPWRRHRRTW